MNITLEPGKYVVAVSGGVDSMVLLHLLHGDPALELVVAHYDHGIREDSHEDRTLVEQTAKGYGLPFHYEEGKLGGQASEAEARQKRYAYLRKIQAETGAAAIVTAHHRDDVLETAVINIIRGTGPRGLSSLRSTDSIKRPLLGVTKSEIKEYSTMHNLQWREDSTNSDTNYLRNHIRHNLLPQLTDGQKEQLYTYISDAQSVNSQIDTIIAEYFNSQNPHGQLERQRFILLPHDIAREVMAVWLRTQGVRTFDKKMLERLTRGAKIQVAGSRISLNDTAFLKIGKEFLALEPRER